MLLLAAAMATAAAEYRAVGTEPFWSLVITARRMRFEQVGGRPVTVRTPRPAAGPRYVTPRMTAIVARQTCSDGMSDRVFPDTVTVVVDGWTFRGCGGLPPVTPPAG